MRHAFFRIIFFLMLHLAQTTRKKARNCRKKSVTHLFLPFSFANLICHFDFKSIDIVHILVLRYRLKCRRFAVATACYTRNMGAKTLLETHHAMIQNLRTLQSTRNQQQKR